MPHLRPPLPTLIVPLLLILGGMRGEPAQAAPGEPSREPINIILMIGDGMQLAHEEAASRYLTGEDRGLAWHRFPYSGYVATWDVTTYDQYAAHQDRPLYREDRFDPDLGYAVRRGGRLPYPVARDADDGYFLTTLPYPGKAEDGQPPATDSAAAATAMATGHKTDKGNVAWESGDPADGQLTSIAQLMREERGAAIGVVTTVPFSHATPAAFVSHNTDRHHYYTGYRGYTGRGIAEEIVRATRPEVVIGGGHPRWNNPERDRNEGFLSWPLYEEIRDSAEYVVAERQAGENGGQLLARAAERARAQGRKLFGLFGGRDGNFEPPVPLDAPGAPEVRRGSPENPTLATAVNAALRVLSPDPDGFFLLVEQGDIDWANHEHDYRSMVGCIWDLDEAVRAVERFIDQPGDSLTWDNTLLIVTADHDNGSLHTAGKAAPLRAGDLPRQAQAGATWSYPDGEIVYGLMGHSNQLVSLYARGAGADRFAAYEGRWYPGTPILDNTQIFRVMAERAAVE